MSKDITLMGASYSAVPAVTLPQTGGGTATFTDVTDTTATAADVAQGKQFYDAAGILTAGTASGGGGVPLKMGAIRPDAELWKSYTLDQMLVADLGVEIPAYTTTSTTLVASSSLERLTLEGSEYDYLVCERTLTIPEYSIATVSKGREEYQMSTYSSEYVNTPSAFPALINPSKTAGTGGMYVVASVYRLFYWSGSSTFTNYSSATYGMFQEIAAPTLTSGTLVISSPNVKIRGNATYLAQKYFEAITDVRLQYVIEVWRVPRSADTIYGWVGTSQVRNIAACVSNGGTLT